MYLRESKQTHLRGRPHNPLTLTSVRINVCLLQGTQSQHPREETGRAAPRRAAPLCDAMRCDAISCKLKGVLPNLHFNSTVAGALIPFTCLRPDPSFQRPLLAVYLARTAPLYFFSSALSVIQCCARQRGKMCTCCNGRKPFLPFLPGGERGCPGGGRSWPNWDVSKRNCFRAWTLESVKNKISFGCPE